MGTTTRTRRTLVAAALSLVCAAAVTGCAPDGPSKQYRVPSGWMSRAEVLDDPQGLGAGFGALGPAESSVALTEQVSGEWDVIEVCAGTETVHVRVEALAAHVSVAAPTKTLGSGDVTCGRTLRIPITVDPAGGFLFTAKPVRGPDTGAWHASVVRRGWQPASS